MHERAGAVTGATAEAITGTLLQRPLAAPPRRALLLTRWGAFTTLWRQEWHPPAREERKLRWFAGTVSALWHVFFGAMLVWLMYLKYLGFTPPPEGDTVVQVEYIGVGTPEEVGGGPEAAQPEQAEQDPAAESSRSSSEGQPLPTAAAAPSDVTPALDAPLPEVAQRDVLEPQIPVPSVEQPVAVSEPTRSEDPVVFVLPPPTRRVSEPKPATPELSASTRPVRAIDVPEPMQPLRPIQIPREVLQRQITLRPIEARVPEVATREVPAPLPRAQVRELPLPTIAQPELRSAAPQVRAARIPTPASPVPAAPASATPSASSTSPAAKTPSSAEKTAAPASSRPRATPSATTAAGAGPKPAAAPGNWPTPSRADDWGDSTRNRPGAQRGVRPGVFNADGSVRLAQTPGSAAPAQPPGTVTQEIKDLDRAGTWLKRRPHDYEPTLLDKYWRPNESLLEEWVRKSIKTVRIPIPGTNKTIVCQTVLLALGGGCGITDPNLNEQPAIARPPPDIPFKPELQEDNGSVKPGG